MKPLLREIHLDRVAGLSGAELRLSDPVVRRMEKLTGIDAERLRATTLARYAGNALPQIPARQRQPLAPALETSLVVRVR